VVIRDDVAGLVDHHAGSGATAVRQPDIDHHHRFLHCFGDACDLTAWLVFVVVIAAREADRIRMKRFGDLRGDPADHTAGHPDHQRDHGEHGEGPPADLAVEENFADPEFAAGLRGLGRRRGVHSRRTQ